MFKLKHLLSDLWRVFDFQQRWKWEDQERTKGCGNATHASKTRTQIIRRQSASRIDRHVRGRLSTESDILCVKVKKYNNRKGFGKKVSQTLEMVDILAAKVKFYTYACRLVLPAAHLRPPPPGNDNLLVKRMMCTPRPFVYTQLSDMCTQLTHVYTQKLMLCIHTIWYVYTQKLMLCIHTICCVYT